jgi:hypothetical protein
MAATANNDNWFFSSTNVSVETGSESVANIAFVPGVHTVLTRRQWVVPVPALDAVVGDRGDAFSFGGIADPPVDFGLGQKQVIRFVADHLPPPVDLEVVGADIGEPAELGEFRIHAAIRAILVV